jgi:cytochrome c oxidase cbb3-type subunit 3
VESIPKLPRVLALGLLLTALPAFPQEGHGVTPADLQRGAFLYFNNCTSCHGPDGDGISGVNLAATRFRRAQSDNDLVSIIRKGIPGTAMPPANIPDDQATLLVAYLHSLAASGKSNRNGPPGDPARGKSIVESKGNCANCHRIGPLGTVAGPDLTSIGAARRASDLERSLLDPDAEIRPENRPVRATAKDGTKIAGTLLNQDTYSIQILDSNAKLRSLQKTNLRDYEFLKTSPMPSYKGRLTDQEISDVVAYLASLKGQVR